MTALLEPASRATAAGGTTSQPPAPRDEASGDDVGAPLPDSIGGFAEMYDRLGRPLREAHTRLPADALVFLVAAYDVVLVRQPDVPGFAHFADRLAHGLPRLRVVGALTASPEFAARHAHASLHARLPFVMARRVRAALPVHASIYALTLAPSVVAPVVGPQPPADPPGLFAIGRRVDEVLARHWELRSLVRETRDDLVRRVDERVDLASGDTRPT